MDSIWQDIRFAAKQLRRNLSFTIVAVLTLAMGIGANTAIFSVVNAVLLRALPYRQPDQLVRIHGLAYKGELLELRTRARTIDVAASVHRELSLTGEGEAVRLEGAAATAELFALLGVEPSIGRAFRAGEDQLGHDAVVVLSDGLWRTRFGANPGIIGSQILLDGRSRTVVGVMPASVRYPSSATQLWVPLPVDPTNRIELWSTGVAIIGRLRPGATLAQARAEVRALAPQMRELFPWSMPAEYGTTATVVPLREHIVGGIKPLLLILLGAVGLVLLAACVNIANLQLVRTAARHKEYAIRAALGAGTGRLVRQMLTESVLLALTGGAAGLLVAIWGVQLLTTALPADTPRLAEVRIDGRVLAATLAMALTTGFALGLLPALRATRSDTQAGLKDGGRGSSAGIERRRLSAALVAGQVALAVVLVAGAGLLVRSFWNLLQVNPGFRAERVMSATIAPPAFRYSSDASRRDFYQQVLQRLDALPGTRAAAAASTIPFGGQSYQSVFIIEGRPDPTRTGDWPLADVSSTVSADYFRAMGVPIIRGRGLTDADRDGAPRVVVISESLARRYWPGEDPIGKRIRGPGGEDWMTIVGIAGDVKWDQMSEVHRSAFYRPILQALAPGRMSAVVRTTADPQASAANLRGVMASLDPDTPVSDIRSMDQLIAASLQRPRLAMALFGIFAGLALALGAIGIYGVIAYAVSQRTRELGVRVALGAQRGDLLRLVVGQGGRLALAGIALGLIGSLAATRLLSKLLYGVSANDPMTLTAVVLLLGGVALLASWIPARRAARVDPMVALRAE